MVAAVGGDCASPGMTSPVRFAHLHIHSEYSLLDGANRIKLQDHHAKHPDPRVKSLVTQVQALGMSAVALTDHGNMCGAIEFYREARSKGVKAILGMEGYVAAGSRFDKTAKLGDKENAHHLTLLVHDAQGLRNLTTLSSLGHEEGFHYRPRIDRELLAKHQAGLIVLSGCLAAEVPQLLLRGKTDEARAAAGWFKEVFGPDRYFVELMDHGLPEQKAVNRGLVELAKALGLETVATNDAHYLEKADAFPHEALLCIQTGKTLADPQRMRFAVEEFYVKSPEEMARVFAELPDAVTRSWEIAERCGLELVFADESGKLNFPPFPIPAGFASADELLRHLCMAGLKQRYGGAVGDTLERLDHELRVIRDMGFATYFLIVGDIVATAKERGILVGPGRGSAAGSLVAYVLGITDLDPIKYDLIFERFLNSGRKEPPDIDIDFPDNRRDEVVEYVKQKYGAENVAQIVTFARMNARAVVRDVGRVMGLPYAEMDKLAKMIPGGPNSSLAEGLKTEEVKNALAANDQYAKILEVSRVLESLARHASKHAAGVVIAPPTADGGAGGLRSWAPLIRLEGGGGDLVTQYDMDGIKALGLLKIDLLGLKTLTVLDETRQIVRRTRGSEIVYATIPLDDRPTYTLFAEGKTDGIFQFESSGMRDALRKLKPDHLEDLIALNALYRPGPMEQIDTYIHRRRGETFKYDVPELEPILKATYGIVVYQEQVIQIVHKLAGYTMAKADDFRRSMGKKKAEIMAREQKTFIEGATRNRIPRAEAEKIFAFLEKFAGYGFNRSHSAAYALLAYWTAYLKTHFPVEFMAALLTSEMGNHDKIAEYVGECRKLKLTVLPPDVNHSLTAFSVEALPAAAHAGTNGGNGHPADGSGGEVRQAVRFGLAAVKNVGESATDVIVKAREERGPFKSLQDFINRAGSGAINRKVLESLIRCGAFDAHGASRDALLAGVNDALDRAARRLADRSSGQASLFGETAEDDEPVSSAPLHAADASVETNRLAAEKELLGCYVSGHPLAEYEDEIRQFSTQSLKPEKLAALVGALPIKIAGVVSRVKQGLTKKKDPFARFMIEDLEGSIEALAWSEVLKKSGRHLTNGAILMVTGVVQRSEDKPPALIVKEIMPLEEAQVRLTRAVHLHLNTVGSDEGMLKSVQQLVTLSPGDASVYLHLVTLHHGEAVLEASQAMRVKPTRELVTQLRALLGDEAVTLADRQLTPV